MGVEVGNGQVAIFPTFRGFRRNTLKEIEGAEREGSARFRKGFAKSSATAGQDAGRGFRKSFTTSTSSLGKEMQADVAKAARAVSTARLKEQDAAGRVRVAEAQLAETRKKYAADSSQVVRAEERLASTQRTLMVAQDATRSATDRLTAAQRNLAEATAAAGKSASGFSVFRSNLSNLIAPVTALSRGVVNLAGRAFTPLLRSVGEFTKRMTGPVRSAVSSATASVRDFGLNVAMKVVSPLATAENFLRAKFAPQIQAVRGVLAPVGKSFQGAFGLAAQAVRGVGAVVGPVAAGIGQVFTATMAGVRRVSADAARSVSSAFKVAGAAVATALGAALVGGFSRLSNIETAEARMRGLGFAAADVAKAMQNAQDAANGTSFSLDELAGAASMAMTAGVKPGQQLVKYLEAIKGAATASGAPVSELAAIFGKVRTNGRAYTEDINRLAERQIPIWDALAKQIGVSSDRVRTMATEGKITAEVYESAVRNAVGGMAAEVGQTTAASARNARTALSKLGAVLLGGVFPAFKSVFDTIKTGLQGITRLVEPIATAFGERLAGSVDALTSRLQSVFSALKPGDLDVSGIAGSFGVLLPILGAVAGSLGALLGRIPVLSGVLGGVTAPLGLVVGLLGSLMAFKPETLIAGFDSLIPAVNGAVVSLLNGLTSVLSTLGTTLLPRLMENLPILLQGATQLVQGLIDGIVSALPGLLNVLVGIAPQLVTVVLGMVPVLLKAGAQLLQGLVEGAATAIPLVIDAVVALLPSLITAITSMLPRIITVGINLFLGLVTAIVTAIPRIVSALVAAIPQVLTAILGALPLLIDAGVQLFLGLVESLATVIPQLIVAVTQMLPQIVTTLIGMIPLLLQTAVQLFVKLVDAIPVILPRLVTAIIGMIPRIVSALLGMIPQLLNAAVQLFTGLVTAVPQIVPKLVSAVLGLGPKMVGAVQGMIPKMLSVGKDLIRGLGDGIASMGQWVLDKIGSVVNGAVNWAKGLLGIHSPSRVFRVIGQYTGEGLALGIQDEQNRVQKAMDRLVPSADVPSRIVQAVSAAAAVQPAVSGSSPAGSMPRELVVVDADGQLIGRMRVEADAQAAARGRRFESDVRSRRRPDA